jgi:hypothetical protein
MKTGTAWTAAVKAMNKETPAVRWSVIRRMIVIMRRISGL